MKHRFPFLCALVLLTAAMLPLPAAAAKTPDVTVLLRQAALRLKHVKSLSTAYLVSATGTTANGKGATTAAGITNWTFFYNTTVKPYSSATILYAKGKFSATRVTKGYGFPSIGGGSIKPLPTMTLTRAVQLVRVRHRQPFFTVELSHLPQYAHTDYVFFFSATSGFPYAIVDTQTGKVTYTK